MHKDIERETYLRQKQMLKNVLNLIEWFVEKKDYDMIFDYYYYWQFYLVVNLLLAVLNKFEYIPYILWRHIEELLLEFLPDNLELKKERVDNFLSKLEKSKIKF
jgi:hypothetical protein